jgi:hypothetical protein
MLVYGGRGNNMDWVRGDVLVCFVFEQHKKPFFVSCVGKKKVSLDTFVLKIYCIGL